MPTSNFLKIQVKFKEGTNTLLAQHDYKMKHYFLEWNMKKNELGHKVRRVEGK